MVARVESLGLHAPVALPYLISEGILPKDPKKDLYQWETYVFRDGDIDVEEEVLATKDCVVWSQGKFLRNVLNFDLDGEEVRQAILTSFPSVAYTPTVSGRRKYGGTQCHANAKHVVTDISSDGSLDVTGSQESPEASSSRALAVFLKSKVHIHYLHGASHIIDLPFEIERALPTLRGCIVQRRRLVSSASPPTPKIPLAPPNSFFSSQLQPASSYLQSPNLAKSFASTRPSQPSPLQGNRRLDALFDDLLAPKTGVDENEVASLYSLTSPLSDFGVLSHSVRQYKSRQSNRDRSGVNIEFEALDPAESVVYASSSNELGSEHGSQVVPLMLLVTVNDDLQVLTVWHAWYLNGTTLRNLLEKRAVQKAAKARRRSSFMSASIGTGATTPAVRQREHTRESLVGGGSLRLPTDPAPAPHTALSTRKRTKQDEEAVMASRMDPDYQPIASQPPGRDNRRVSSLNPDMRASQSGINASFGTGARRNASFGVPNERRSFGHRKSRGSTPGSIFSRSVGPDDDTMDVDDTEDLDNEEVVENVLRHVRLTFEAAGADSVFGSAEEGYKRELVVRKLHSVVVSPVQPAIDRSKSFKVVVLRNNRQSLDGDDAQINVYIHDAHTRSLQCLRLLVKDRPLWPGNDTLGDIAVPIVVTGISLDKCEDVTKLKDGDVEAVLLGQTGMILSTRPDQIHPLPMPVPYRAYHALHAHPHPPETDVDFGRNRTLPAPSVQSLRLGYSGSYGSYDEASNDGLRHRRKITLQPTNGYVNRLLEVCETVLPAPQADTVRPVWCIAHAWLSQHPDSLSGTASSLEMVAFATMALFFAIPLLDAKAKAALKVTELAAGKQTAPGGPSSLMKRHREARLFSTSAWSWTADEHPPPATAESLTGGSRDPLLSISATLALELFTLSPRDASQLGDATGTTSKLIQALHVFREEQRLQCLTLSDGTEKQLAAVIMQLGSFLGLAPWSCSVGTFYSLEVGEDNFSFVRSSTPQSLRSRMMDEPVSAFQWFEHAMQNRSYDPYPSLAVVAGFDASTSVTKDFCTRAETLTPKMTLLSAMLEATLGLTTSPSAVVESMAKHGFSTEILEGLPDAIAAPFREAVARCERQPPTAWSEDLLRLVGREDLVLGSRAQSSVPHTPSHTLSSAKDVQAVCHALDQHAHPAKTREAGRHAVSQLIFSEDRRLVEASALMHFNSVQTAECPKQPDWTDQFHLEQQRRVMQWVMIRMIALPVGDGMIHFDSQTPLMTEKFHLAGFNSTCLMQPMGHALTIDRSGLTEEKVNWAYFHAGASAGLRISRSVKGIDTSWIAFNKPNELTNRHAGLLLALGLGGHLRSLAKWLSFKYLTPKHPMTSVGLLLGLSASYIGSMDSLITRMLSVHITRMLPPGAAELNVSPITQSAGLMGIGLLYYNTQHRRMTEIMLSEIEYMEVEDPDSGPDQLRDESYRLAAGFALGLINLGKGQNLRGLHGMYLPERLLAVAVGSRPIQAVHVFDRATAGAIIAVALIYMKSGDKAIARKIDIPDTQAQFDHVRPDMLMLRAMAKHIILWDDIAVREDNQHVGQPAWINSNLPTCYKNRLDAISQAGGKMALKTSDVPFYNIVTGLAWALSMKYAGSGNSHARDEILAVLDCFYTIRGGGDVFYYDAKLARSTLRRCIDVLALSAATVMAGTGDIKTFRYLRRLHGRVDPETTYGSHLASHLGIGVLFLGGGTYTLGTSDLAVGSLMCAFYPLFPTDVHDNRVHLQAFRHLWVFAAEARCLVIQDSDTSRPLTMQISVSMKDGSTRHMTAPCLLPNLDQIATVQTEDPAYWLVTLDFAGNASHLAAFRQNQRIYVRRCPASEAHASVFSATLAAANGVQSSDDSVRLWQSVFDLPGLRELDKADVELILPVDAHTSTFTDERGTVVDGRLAFAKAVSSGNGDELWNLRLLFAWAERVSNEGDGKMKWIGSEVVEALRARIDQRSREGGQGDN